MSQAHSGRPLTTQARVRARAIPCGIYGGQSDTGREFPLSSSVLSWQYHSTIALRTNITWGRNNRPADGLISETVSPIDMNSNMNKCSDQSSETYCHQLTWRSIVTSIRSERQGFSSRQELGDYTYSIIRENLFALLLEAVGTSKLYVNIYQTMLRNTQKAVTFILVAVRTWSLAWFFS
jgi:hypothetical protein